MDASVLSMSKDTQKRAVICVILATLAYGAISGLSSARWSSQNSATDSGVSVRDFNSFRRLKSHFIKSATNDPHREYMSRPVGMDKVVSLEEDFKARIVGGLPSPQGAFPFYVHSTGSALCGGTLIHEDIVLTAAHCFDTFTEDVIIGSNDIFGRDGAERIPVEMTLPHPLYSNQTEQNDIMLLKLRSSSNSSLVTLNLNPVEPADDEEVTVLGFGYTAEPETEGAAVSIELQEVNINIIDFETCDALLGVPIFADSQICAGNMDGGRDSCAGDSGGPLLSLDGQQYGVVSYGIGCGQPNRPAVYTRLSAFADWIREGICSLSENPPSDCPERPPVDSPVEPETLPTAAPTVVNSTTSSPTLAPLPVIAAPVQRPTPRPLISIPHNELFVVSNGKEKGFSSVFGKNKDTVSKQVMGSNRESLSGKEFKKRKSKGKRKRRKHRGKGKASKKSSSSGDGSEKSSSKGKKL
ncbi:hypothetical protein FisN_10Lh214 [Fistulifera solaris]|uniref:Peptidase S1 domain-containing protein n=1 Tax=Fistulifera solaris TaxID=1519565 RepID=A0A1Z5JU06_FISSO|nr:hypothetical protein FisN_10Lh214 [Fistulifera solaris]|eukprot:GAX17346.1 hypothetical protein FisN_10Lh214 [Fistulifera solaris]